MILNSVVFSLGEPKDNLYINMFLLCFFSLRKKGVFNPATDTYYLTCDGATAQYIEEKLLLLRGIKLLVVPKPKDCYEGMKLKYVLPYLIQVDDTVLYVDVDMFALKGFRVGVEKDTIVVLPEGRPTDSNYCGDLKLSLPYGFTAGFFAYRWGEKVKNFFSSILASMDRATSRHYTLDQPWFNKHLEEIQLKILPPGLVSGNGHGDVQQAFFVNCCGEPGDGSFHWVKMLQLYLQFS